MKFKFWQLAALVLGAVVLFNLLQPKAGMNPTGANPFNVA